MDFAHKIRWRNCNSNSVKDLFFVMVENSIQYAIHSYFFCLSCFFHDNACFYIPEADDSVFFNTQTIF